MQQKLIILIASILCHAVQLPEFFTLFSGCLHHLFRHSGVEVAKPLPAGGKLLVLHELEAGVCAAAAHEHGGYLRCRSRHRPLRGPARKTGVADGEPRAQPRHSVLVQVLQLCSGIALAAARTSGDSAADAGVRAAPARWHIVLHVSGAGLFHRRLSRADGGRKKLFHLRSVRLVFPAARAGPIERSTHLLPQFKVKQRLDYDAVMEGIRLMIWGYFLKLALADRCGTYVDAVYNNLTQHNGGSYLLASLIFPFQIYGDFAGYSLVAIGAARVMGFRLMDNFRRPYFAATVTDFWHRWHISLSTWFKDYVYIPLGGNRVGKARGYFNLLVTFVVSGAWHGANWTFIVWGALHGIILCIEKFLGFAKKPMSGASKFFHWLATFCLVALAWIFFRAETVADAGRIIKGIFTNLEMPYLPLADCMAIFMTLSIVLFKECKDEFHWNIHLSDSRYWVVRHTYIAAAICYILLFGVLNGDQFIYFQF